jgi:hypothetical protein
MQVLMIEDILNDFHLFSQLITKINNVKIEWCNTEAKGLADIESHPVDHRRQYSSCILTTLEPSNINWYDNRKRLSQHNHEQLNQDNLYNDRHRVDRSVTDIGQFIVGLF